MNKDITFCNPQCPCEQCNYCQRKISAITQNKDFDYCSVADFSLLIGFSKECKFFERKNYD